MQLATSEKETSIGLTSTCPACGGSRTWSVLQLGQIPVGFEYLSQCAAVDAPLATITLINCDSCQYLYCSNSENDAIGNRRCLEHTRHYSDRFREYAEQSAEYLGIHYDLQGMVVIEV